MLNDAYCHGLLLFGDKLVTAILVTAILSLINPAYKVNQ